MGNLVTVVMSTFNNFDFTKSAIFAMRKYYPDIRIILADGGSTDRTKELWYDFADDFVVVEDGCAEDCRNAAAVLVDTPYILLMDNDAKPLGERALPLLVEAMEENKNAAQVSAYCVKVTHEKGGYCSKEFSDIMECDWSPSYFSLHKTEAWLEVNGMPKEWYYGCDRKISESEKRWHNGGDASISKYYQRAGWKIYTPRERVPVLHWSQAAWWNVETYQHIVDWWMEYFQHVAINPLNDWEKYLDKTDWENKRIIE